MSDMICPFKATSTKDRIIYGGTSPNNKIIIEQYQYSVMRSKSKFCIYNSRSNGLIKSHYN